MIIAATTTILSRCLCRGLVRGPVAVGSFDTIMAKLLLTLGLPPALP